MAGVCFFFENNDVDVWSGKNLDAWNYAMSASKDINKVHVINRTKKKLKNPDSSKYYFTISKNIPVLKGKIAGFVVPWRKKANSISLWNFDHNVDWYCFGSAAGELPNYNVEIYIQQNGFGALHSVHIASITLLHRYGVLS